MARLAVLLSVLLSAASIQSAVASASCARRYRAQADCVQKCKARWDRMGKLAGSDPWGSVVSSENTNTSLEDYIAKACGVRVSSAPVEDTILNSGPINAAPLPETKEPAVVVTPKPVTTSSSTASVTSSSSADVEKTPVSSTSNVAPTTSSNPPAPASSSPPPRMTTVRTTTTQAPPQNTPAPAPSTTTTRTTATPVPSSAPAPPQNGDIQAWLDAHNSIRRNHGAADLKWSDTLASAAQTWANRCVTSHSQGAVGPYGENLAKGHGSIAAAVKGWTDEVSQYNPANPQFSHFTQVVWKSTTELGCAVKECGGKLYVCEYNPPGNFIGRFAENVQV